VGRPRVSDDGGVRTITLDRPEVLNALMVEDLDAIAAAVRDLPASVVAVVVTGAGERAFSAGMHLQSFLETAPDQGRELIDHVAACTEAVRLAPVPTVAAVRGYCLGAAFEIALACDFRVAEPGAQFGLPEVRLGIPSVVDAALLLHHVGLSLAKELILTGRTFAVDRLPGLVNRVAATDGLDAAVADLLAELADLTPEVVVAQKALFETWLNVGLQRGLDASRDVFADVFAQPATQQAIAGYAADKRR
jgi:enoyl-CoA hydratase